MQTAQDSPLNFTINNMQDRSSSGIKGGPKYLNYIDDSQCFPNVVPEIILGPQEYIPEIWSIKKDLVYKAISCLQGGLENTQSALVEHDVALGRTTTKNRMWAETLEQEIRDMKDCIKQLKVMNASNSTHYP